VNVNLLIDALVRQTTVLVAQLATAAGSRAQLAHTANQVFLDLVRSGTRCPARARAESHLSAQKPRK